MPELTNLNAARVNARATLVLRHCHPALPNPDRKTMFDALFFAKLAYDATVNMAAHDAFPVRRAPPS